MPAFWKQIPLELCLGRSADDLETQPYDAEAEAKHMVATFKWQTKQPSTESLLRAPTLELGAPSPASTRPAQPAEDPPLQSLRPSGEKEQSAHPTRETAPSPAKADRQQVPAVEGTHSKAGEQTNAQKRKQAGPAAEHPQQPRRDASTPLENTGKRSRKDQAATAPTPPDQCQEATAKATQGKDMQQAKQQAKRAKEPKSVDDRPAKAAKTAGENGAAKRKQQSMPADSNCDLPESQGSRGDLEEVALAAAARATQDAIDGLEAKAVADPTQDDHHQAGPSRDKNCNVHGKALPAAWCAIPYVTPGDQNKIAPKAKAKAKASDMQEPAAPKRKGRAKAKSKAKVPPGEEHEEDVPTGPKPAKPAAKSSKSRAKNRQVAKDKENRPPPDNASEPQEVETGAVPAVPADKPSRKAYEKTAEQKAKNARKSAAYARKMAEMLRTGMSKDEAKVYAKEARQQ